MRIIIHIDDEDLRQVTAYLPSGAELGILKARGRWGVTKHDLSTRKAIFRLKSKRVMVLTESADPIHAYLKHISTKSSMSKNGALLTPKKATDVVRVSQGANVVPLIGTTEPPDGQPKKGGPKEAPLSPAGNGRFLLPPPSEDLFKVENR
jgi:hypothetical protein